MSTPLDLRRPFLWLSLVIILLGVSPFPACAQNAPIDILKPIDSVGLLEPNFPPAPGGPKFYSWTGPSPTWRVAQWNMPAAKLSPFTSAIVSGKAIYSSTSPEASVTITQANNATTVELSQDGTVLPCDTPEGIPRESDLFLSPNGKTSSPPGITGLALPNGRLPLSQLSSLTFSSDISVVEGHTTKNTGCKVNQAGSLLGIVLRNTVVTPHQTLFYQLSFSKLCGDGTPQRVALCRSTPGRTQFYFTTNPFGASDMFTQLGRSFVRSNESQQVNVDVLPRLQSAIETGPSSLDHDVSHWELTEVYLGQHIWGDVTMSSIWTNIHLLAGMR